MFQLVNRYLELLYGDTDKQATEDSFLAEAIINEG